MGVASNITFLPGLPSADVDGPIISFLTESGRSLRSSDHIKKGEKIKIKISILIQIRFLKIHYGEMGFAVNFQIDLIENCFVGLTV